MAAEDVLSLGLEGDANNSPLFHQFRNEALDESTDSRHRSDASDMSIINWNSRLALEGDRFNQMENLVYKVVGDGVLRITKAIDREKKKTKEHSAVLINIANNIIGYFEV
ncbi:hypothetical protein BGX38DRAFT_1279242 [Terfezia claveryi]|nr:hypothetical protein BGX38DRAFT_1279242 [Terfezia claveryi]